MQNPPFLIDSCPVPGACRLCLVVPPLACEGGEVVVEDKHESARAVRLVPAACEDLSVQGAFDLAVVPVIRAGYCIAADGKCHLVKICFVFTGYGSDSGGRGWGRWFFRGPLKGDRPLHPTKFIPPR